MFELIERGEQWLKKNTYKNPILKWNTEEWGEIPADFGRALSGRQQRLLQDR